MSRLIAFALILLPLFITGCASLGISSVADGDAMAAYLAAQVNLPVIERSDWINVKTDITPGAVGDGIADDTAAIQAALSMLEGRRPATRAVYLPPGTYRITDTLVVTQVQGGAIYGHGRATVIAWDGPEGVPGTTAHGESVLTGSRMFHSNGFGRNLFFGLTWDGRGKAAVGVDHDSKGYYETRVRHQYCAFLNFQDSGIRVGHDQKTASAEMMFYDCYFENCGRGITFLAFNDYDNAIARCIFRNCGSGVHCHRGNVYVRDCHFENSRDQDLLLAVHSHSVRRCTSVGSNAFIRCSQPGSYANMIAVQDCRVSDWHDPAGAIQTSNRGPLLVFDSIFAQPAVKGSPAIALLDTEWEQSLLTANLATSGMKIPIVSHREHNRLLDIPRHQPDFLIATRAHRRWEHRPQLPTRIFDAKVDFGATGNNVDDDAEAIQRTIDAAAAHGDGAQAYLPAGVYRVASSLRLGPGNYSLGGPIGRRTELVWAGPDGGTMIAAHNTDGAILSQLFLAAPQEAKVTGLHVTADRPGAIVLDGIWSGGNHQPDFRGTLLDQLPSGYTVTSSHLDGELTIDRCGDADILLDYWFTSMEGALTLRGTTGSGFIAIHSAAGSHNNPDMTILDNASIVIGDFYTEQTLRSLVAAGQPGQPPGRITISYAKLACRQPEIVSIDGYAGQVTVSRANMICRPGLNAEGQPVAIGEKTVSTVSAQAVLPVDNGQNTVLLLLGNTHLFAPPEIRAPEATVIQLGNNVWRGEDEAQNQPLVPDSPADATAVRAVNVALDHFRELSERSLR